MPCWSFLQAAALLGMVAAAICAMPVLGGSRAGGRGRGRAPASQPMKAMKAKAKAKGKAKSKAKAKARGRGQGKRDVEDFAPEDEEPRILNENLACKPIVPDGASASSSSADQRARRNMLGQLNQAVQRLEEGKSKHPEEDERKSQLLSHYNSLEWFSNEKMSLLQEWEKDKSCSFWKSFVTESMRGVKGEQVSNEGMVSKPLGVVYLDFCSRLGDLLVVSCCWRCGGSVFGRQPPPCWEAASRVAQCR